MRKSWADTQFKHLSILLFLYFSFRFFKLLSLPIFNDEAIYLDWGFREINVPGNLFFSLFDGKQPFLMWIFGIVQNVPVDPLLASRTVSVLTGLCTMIGLYFLGKKVFSAKTAFWASLFYIVIPAFSFFDRQALMESVIAAVGVWSMYTLLGMIESEKYEWAFRFGIITAFGFYIKSSVLIFLFSSFLLAGWQFLRGVKEKRSYFLTSATIIFFIHAVVLFRLYTQPDFLLIFQKNDRFSLTFSELLRFPISHWLHNIFSVFQISFWYLTPCILFFTLLGIVKTCREKNKEKTKLIVWFVLNLLFFVLTVRTPSVRYLVAFLPLSCLFCAEQLLFLRERWKEWEAITILSCFIPALAITFLQVNSPLLYFRWLQSLTAFSQYEEYVSGWPSGYGVREAVNYVESQAVDQEIEVWNLGYWGNPESAVFTYFRQNPRIHIYNYHPDRFKSHIHSNGLPSQRQLPVFVVTRDDIVNDMRPYLELKKRFMKPDGQHSVGVYQLLNVSVESY